MGGLSHTVSGDIASFRTPSRVPLESLKFHFLPKQAAGTPSPEKPIPIEGWTGLNGKRAGKNLLDTSTRAMADHYELNGITFDYNSDGSLTVNGKVSDSATAGPQYRLATWTQKVTGNYYICANAPYSGIYNEVYMYDSDLSERPKKWDGVTASQSSSSGRPLSEVRLLAGHTYSFNVRINRGTDKTYNNDRFYPMLLPAWCIDTTFEPYSGEQIPITFPVAGTNKLGPSVILNNRGHFSLNNGIWSNVVTDERTYIQLVVQLWKSTGTYIKTLCVDYVKTTGRHVLTFTVDDPNGHYICLKHNGTKKDFILLFPWTFGLHQYTISLDVLSADPTTVGGVQLTNIQLEPGDTAHAYEPYSYDNTFYGGYYDPAAGEIVAEYALATATKSDFGQKMTPIEGGIEYRNASKTYLPTASGTNWNTARQQQKFNFGAIANPYSEGSYGDYIGVMYSMSNYNMHTMCISEEVYQAMSDSDVAEISYKLATPIHIPIPAQDLKAFLDHNNFWSDANDITEVTYPVTESKDILATRKKAIAFDHAHHKKVKWNQLVPISSVRSSIVHGQSDGSILVQGTTYTTDFIILTSKTQYFTEITGHKYFLCGNPITNGDAQMLTTTQYRSATLDTGYGTVYESERDSDIVKLQMRLVAGTYDFTIVPVFIDLTVMFGAGNEPTTQAEFERICEINGIDLTTYQPYDEGSDRWLIVP